MRAPNVEGAGDVGGFVWRWADSCWGIWNLWEIAFH